MAPTSLPDFEDLQRTTFDRSPWALEQNVAGAEELTPIVAYDDAHAGTPRPQLTSHVRARARVEIPFDAMQVLDALGEALLQLTLDIFCLESAAATTAYDPSARAAADTLRARIQEIADLRDAINEVVLEASASARAATMFSPGRPLSAYARGILVWATSVVASLATLAAGLRTLTPEWSQLREELASARHWNFDGLIGPAREDLAESGATELAARCEELFWAASMAARGLEKRFG